MVSFLGSGPLAIIMVPDAPIYASRENCDSTIDFLLDNPELNSVSCRLSYWIIYTLLLVVETLLWPALKW